MNDLWWLGTAVLLLLRPRIIRAVEISGRRRRIGTRFVPGTKGFGNASTTHDHHLGQLSSRPHATMMMDRLTCLHYTQPLNHFDLPRNRSGTYQQRFCVSNEFVKNEPSKAPIFFYTGNESPLEEYIEHTGLLWEMAEKFGAQVVFAEHRYEGKSIPKASTPSCMAYSSSIQAITDYARLIRDVLWEPATIKALMNTTVSQNSAASEGLSTQPRPVICFGGSYGGMLSAWIRMRYPQWVAGSIAASAPIWGFPQTNNTGIDAAFETIRHGLSQSYPPNASSSSSQDEQAGVKSDLERNSRRTTKSNNHCSDNLMVSFPLIDIIGREKAGMDFLTKTFRLCQPLQSTDDLLMWLQTPWFDLAEGSFPYPSNYIPFALTHLNVTLPAWPLQHACWKSGLASDYGTGVSGSLTDVKYNITFEGPSDESDANGNEHYWIEVEWDKAKTSTSVEGWVSHPAVSALLASVRNAVAVWYNMTHNETCFEISEAAPNLQIAKEPSSATARRSLRPTKTTGLDSGGDDTCVNRLTTGSWPALCCNEDMNLIITYAQGLGRDVFWPPSLPRTIRTYKDFVEYYSERGGFTDDFCSDPNGTLGFPSEADPWSNWLDLQYASGRVLDGSVSNILFSNGLLDPWSAAGVYLDGVADTVVETPAPRLTIQKNPRLGLAALLMDDGGHHVDLMFSDPVHDTPAFTEARRIEGSYIQQWIDEFWMETEVGL